LEKSLKKKKKSKHKENIEDSLDGTGSSSSNIQVSDEKQQSSQDDNKKKEKTKKKKKKKKESSSKSKNSEMQVGDQNIVDILEAVRAENTKIVETKDLKHKSKSGEEDKEKEENKTLYAKYRLSLDEVPSKNTATMDRRVNARLIPVNNELQMDDIYDELLVVITEMDKGSKYTELYHYE